MPVWQAVIRPSEVRAGQRAITRYFSVCVPKAGLYYVRGYTEASFDPDTDFKVTAQLLEKGGFSACSPSLFRLDLLSSIPDPLSHDDVMG